MVIKSLVKKLSYDIYSNGNDVEKYVTRNQRYFKIIDENRKIKNSI